MKFSKILWINALEKGIKKLTNLNTFFDDIPEPLRNNLQNEPFV
jgi:hypothetical protein